MQVSFVGHDFLFVNPKYEGQYIPPSEAAGKWINYGGDKIWPMPEGDQDENHWVLKSDFLDDGEYKFSSHMDDQRCSATLEGPPDPVTGLQYTRTISIGNDSPAISFHVVMKNIANRTIAWSVQSVSQYDLSDHAGSFNRDFHAFTPVNPHSAYFTAYQVRDGLADDPSFEVKDGLFRLHWLYLENEVWLDSPAGWVAVVDGSSHFAMVERFKYDPRSEYPGKASVIFYKNGASISLDDQLNPQLRESSVSETPFYMEAELNSPMATLKPGESYAFDTEWSPTRAENSFTGVNPAGLVNSHASARWNRGELKLSGSFGVLYPGAVFVEFADDHGKVLGHAALGNADPGTLLQISTEVASPPRTARVRLYLVDTSGMDRGTLDEANVQPGQGGGA